MVKETTVTKTVRVSAKSKKKKTVVSHVVKRAELNARVNDLQVAGDRWMAATADGLYTSQDGGKTWRGGPVLGQSLILNVRSRGTFMVAATHSGVLVSSNGGESWKLMAMPVYVTRVYGVAIALSRNCGSRPARARCTAPIREQAGRSAGRPACA